MELRWAVGGSASQPLWIRPSGYLARQSNQGLRLGLVMCIAHHLGVCVMFKSKAGAYRGTRARFGGLPESTRHLLEKFLPLDPLPEYTVGCIAEQKGGLLAIGDIQSMHVAERHVGRYSRLLVSSSLHGLWEGWVVSCWAASSCRRRGRGATDESF